MKRDILVTGYYGHGNFGDDILAHYVLTQILDVVPAERVVVTSPSHYLEKWFPGIKCVHGVPQDTISKVIFGGGGVFGTIRQLAYFTIRGIGNAIPKYAFCVGVDSPQNFISAWAVGRFLRSFDEISVRDVRSYLALKQLGIWNSRIVVDPSLYLEEKFRDNTPGEGIGIIIRNFPPTYVRDQHTTFISFQKDTAARHVRTWNPEEETIEEFCEYLSQFELVISERMHGIYLAAFMNIPFVAIGASPKMRSTVEMSNFHGSWHKEQELLDAEARRLKQWLVA